MTFKLKALILPLKIFRQKYLSNLEAQVEPFNLSYNALMIPNRKLLIIRVFLSIFISSVRYTV